MATDFSDFSYTEAALRAKTPSQLADLLASILGELRRNAGEAQTAIGTIEGDVIDDTTLDVPAVADATALTALGAVTAPALVYQTDTGIYYYRVGSAWQAFRRDITVADAAALTALGALADGIVAYQADTDATYMRRNGAWAEVMTRATPQAIVVADATALTALGALADGFIAYQADTDVVYYRRNGAWASYRRDIVVADDTAETALGALANGTIIYKTSSDTFRGRQAGAWVTFDVT